MTGPLYQSVFCASGVVFVFHLQEKSSQSDAAEASSENHQEEEDVKPPAGETDASDEDEDEEFGSSDEEILTKSGKKLIFKSSRKNSFRRYCLSLRPMSGALIQLLILSAEVCLFVFFFYFPFPVRHAQRQGTTGEEEEGGRGGEEDSRVNSRVHVEGYMLTAIFVSRQQSRSMKTRRSTMTN